MEESRICFILPNGTNTLREDQGGRKGPGVHVGGGRKETGEEARESREGP